MIGGRLPEATCCPKIVVDAIISPSLESSVSCLENVALYVKGINLCHVECSILHTWDRKFKGATVKSFSRRVLHSLHMRQKIQRCYIVLSNPFHVGSYILHTWDRKFKGATIESLSRRVLQNPTWKGFDCSTFEFSVSCVENGAPYVKRIWL
jgi:hypothetical protein